MFILFCQLNVFHVIEIAIVFNLILRVILLHCFRAIIPQPVVDTSCYYPWNIPYDPTRVNTTNYKFLFVYVLRRWRVRDKEYANIENFVRKREKRLNNIYLDYRLKYKNLSCSTFQSKNLINALNIFAWQFSHHFHRNLWHWIGWTQKQWQWELNFN